MRVYTASGTEITRGSYSRDYLSYTITGSGLPLKDPVIWDTCPNVMGSTALTTTTITASGARGSVFLTPPRDVLLYAVATRVTAALAGIPTASGMFGLYSNISDTLSGDVNNNFYPNQLIWQSEPFVCSSTGIYIRYPQKVLRRNTPYWLIWLGTRNSTMYTPSAQAVLCHGHGLAAGIGNIGLSVAISPVTHMMPDVYPNAGAYQTTVNPLLFYQLADIQ
jgi:hypothetical protein